MSRENGPRFNPDELKPKRPSSLKKKIGGALAGLALGLSGGAAEGQEMADDAIRRGTTIEEQASANEAGAAKAQNELEVSLAKERQVENQAIEELTKYEREVRAKYPDDAETMISYLKDVLEHKTPEERLFITKAYYENHLGGSHEKKTTTTKKSKTAKKGSK